MSKLLRRPHAEGCPSGLMLDRLVAGELNDTERAEIEHHLQSCLPCAACLAQNEAFRLSFAAAPPPLRRRPPPPRPVRKRRWPLALGGVLAAAAAAVAIVPRLNERGSAIRAKGDPRLTFFVESHGGVHAGRSGDVLPPGARVQFAYSHPTPFWLALLSLDGAGKASVYFPEGAEAAGMPAGRDLLLPVSTVLDDALGPEHIFGLFCDHAVSLAPIRDELARGRTEPPLPAGCRQIRLTWEKRASR